MAKLSNTFLIILSCFWTFPTLSQERDGVTVKHHFKLPAEIVESSGIEKWNEKLWTFNDSGAPKLYMLDTAGTIMKRYLLPAEKTHDWEDMTQDDRYLYIADTGNNAGRRDTVTIIMVEKKWLLLDSVVTKRIRFVWPRGANGKSLNFDCEAVESIGDSLLLFTKEWTPRRSQIFIISKTPGLQAATFKSSIKTRLLITGSATDTVRKRIILLGYNRWLKPQLLSLPLGGNKALLKPRRIRSNFKRCQTEAICYTGGKDFLITNEAFRHWVFKREPELIKIAID